jgi:Domain of unknown function (DUF4118)
VLRHRSWTTGLVVAVGAVAVITGINYGLRELVPVVSTGVVYLLAVLLVSTGWGFWLGLLTALLGAAAFNFFHIPPTGRFTIADGENWVALAVFLVAAGVVSWLANAARSRAEEAERRRGEADLAAEMARILLTGGELGQSLRTVGQRIAAAFGLSSVGVELSWADSDERRRALPLLVDGSRIGTVMVPARHERGGARRAPGPRAAGARDARGRGAAARRARGPGHRDQGPAALQRGQDGGSALGLARPSLAAHGDHRRGRRARVGDALG